ncbi:MAG TPA: hypothetical protein EYP40_03650 [Chromatiales bacterium]|nr:hypothetical protein [Chromatiales bacterium]
MIDMGSQGISSAEREEAERLLRQAIESEKALEQQRDRVHRWYPFILVGVGLCATLLGMLVFWLVGIPLSDTIPALIVIALVAAVGVVLTIDKYCAHRVHKVHTLKVRASERYRRITRQGGRSSRTE